MSWSEITCYGCMVKNGSWAKVPSNIPTTQNPLRDGWKLVDNSDGKYHPVQQKIWLCPKCLEEQ